jgi:hypothetical protein
MTYIHLFGIFAGLFKGDAISPPCMRSNIDINVKSNRHDVAENSCCPMLGMVHCVDWVKPPKEFVRIVDVSVDIQTWHLPESRHDGPPKANFGTPIGI